MEREILGNVGDLEGAMYGIIGSAIALGSIPLAFRARRWLAARWGQTLLPLGNRLRDFLRLVVWQKEIAAGDRASGIMHRLIFYGFAGLFLATTLTAIDHYGDVHFLQGDFYLIFSLAADLSGVAFVIGIFWALFRRYVKGPERLSYRMSGDALALLLLVASGVTGFIVEGARLADNRPTYEGFSFAGYSLGVVFDALGLEGRDTYRALWLLHVVIVAGLFAAIPATRLRHLAIAPFSILFGSRPLGQLEPAPPAFSKDGAAMPRELALQLDACTACGRCTAVCPASLSHKPLSPMHLLQQQRHDPWGEFVDDAVLWSCTTCGACERACPESISHVPRIVDLRRQRVDLGRIDAVGARGLESVATDRNPWGRPPEERTLWAQGLPVRVLAPGEQADTLFWVGCAGAFDRYGREVTRATAKLLLQAGIELATLGTREGCTGDIARRLGEEGLFQELATGNIALLREHGIRRIMTHCPHCLHTFAREYPKLGGRFEVIHHSELLSQLVAEGRLHPQGSGGGLITMHDPCYLARYQGVIAPPRALLQAIPGTEIVEMPRHGEHTFCCGGGGGLVLVDMRIGERIPTIRVDEASGTGARIIATACPFCRLMLDPAANERSGELIQVRDIAEVLAKACGIR